VNVVCSAVHRASCRLCHEARFVSRGMYNRQPMFDTAIDREIDILRRADGYSNIVRVVLFKVTEKGEDLMFANTKVPVSGRISSARFADTEDI